MEELCSELQKVFTIAANARSLSPQQIYIVYSSVRVLGDAIDKWDIESKEAYIQHYNILAKLLSSAQTNGSIFTLEDAANVFNSLTTIKEYLEKQEVTDELEEQYKFLQLVVNKYLFKDNTYSMAQIAQIVGSLEKLSQMGTISRKDDDNDYGEILKELRKLIDTAQERGLFTLEQAANIIKLFSKCKSRIMKYNISPKKQLEKKNRKKKTDG